ncbi:hypothetical protein diail_3741 [Diaporthe ilicicola]|nr:hypothetical protein diail_3741 [Diaporthe ilicicola]
MASTVETIVEVAPSANISDADQHSLADRFDVGNPSNPSGDSRHDAADSEPPTTTVSQHQRLANKPSGAAIALTMVPLCLSVLLSSLDLTMVTPAVPSIAADLQSSSGYIWVGGAFILGSTAVTPVWGSVADIWGRKPIMLIAQAFFFAGSLLCALAPNMDAFIAGRGVQGIGASGMGILVNTIICDSFSMRDRGLYLAITSIMWAVGTAVGPILGGVFTTRVHWRWCFWMNLPIGALVFVAQLLFLKLPVPNIPVLSGLKAVDWTGSLLIVGSALMVLLGLEFGGATFPWSSAAVICLITFGTVVLGFFLLNEWKLAPNPVVPLRLFSNGSTVAAYLVYSVLGANALVSGVHLLPLIVSSSLAAACTGIFIQNTGIYLPIMYGAQVLLTLGTGLFTNLAFEENITKLVIYQIITGVGVGFNMEPPLLVAQATATALDTAAVISTMSFLRSISTAIIVVVGGVIFQGQMVAENNGLAAQIGPDLAAHFNGEHATASVNLIRILPYDVQDIVRRAYFKALRAVWIMRQKGLFLDSKGHDRKKTLGSNGTYAANEDIWSPTLPTGTGAKDEVFITLSEEQCDIPTRRRYITKLCKATLVHRSPTHRIVPHIQMAARALDMEVYILYVPDNIIIAFDGPDGGDDNKHGYQPTEVKLVQGAGTHVGKMLDAHEVYKHVQHSRISRRDDGHNVWFMFMIFGFAAVGIAPFAYRARFIDLPVAFITGSLLGVMQPKFAPSHPLCALIFRGHGRRRHVLYRPHARLHHGRRRLTQCSINLLMPGYWMTSAALEIMTKNIVTGGSRMMYALIYSLLLAYGIAIGSTLYGYMDYDAVSNPRCGNLIDRRWNLFFVPFFSVQVAIISRAKWRQIPA